MAGVPARSPADLLQRGWRLSAEAAKFFFNWKNPNRGTKGLGNKLKGGRKLKIRSPVEKEPDFTIKCLLLVPRRGAGQSQHHDGDNDDDDDDDDVSSDLKLDLAAVAVAADADDYDDSSADHRTYLPQPF